VPVLRLTVAYDGTGFHGWARQRDPAIRTVEGEMLSALRPVVREDVRLSVAGRTDAGVHARGQVVSFASDGRIAPDQIAAAVNERLAPEIVVFDASWAPAGFDARFSATAREYRYRINAGALPDPFSARYEWHRPVELSLARMRAAAVHLAGEHDFASFCRRPGEDRSTVRDLQRLAVIREGDRYVLSARANAFLHQMVRSLVGTLIAMGEGRLDPDQIPVILGARDRSAAGPVAPPQGLTLERIVYGRRPLTGSRSRR
jgi:tRNA pseudouridine38-40 synthase